MKSRTTGAICFVVLFSAVLLSGVDSFFKIGRELDKHAGQQSLISKHLQKRKSFYTPIKDEPKHPGPSVTIAAKEKDALLEAAFKRIKSRRRALERKNLNHNGMF